MKKLKWMLLLVVVLLMALPAVALADDGIASPEFFTWEMLATYAGAVLATTLIVQLTKGIGFIDRLPTRIYSYFIAVIVLVLAALFTNTLTEFAAKTVKREQRPCKPLVIVTCYPFEYTGDAPGKFQVLARLIR